MLHDGRGPKRQVGRCTLEKLTAIHKQSPEKPHETKFKETKTFDRNKTT